MMIDLMRNILIFLLFFSDLTKADISAKVISVIDGDTIYVRDYDNKTHKIRLAGIDAPEMSQPYGKESRSHLLELIYGKEVFIEAKKNDRYGRIIGTAFHKGIDVNLVQVKEGMAWWYEYYKDQQSPEDQRLYSTAHDRAKKDKVGLWEDPLAINPYKWRKSKK
ncbi:MAG: thermonuclease family protein [Pseudomonadota bacterium]|nr:thermonuclease family protein [Pseudomonadota bacterium]